jgi:hypothetical protein
MTASAVTASIAVYLLGVGIIFPTGIAAALQRFPDRAELTRQHL